MSWRGNNVRLARLDDAPAIAEVHVASWRTTYKGIFSDTLLDSLSVDKREQSWRETLALPEPNSVTLVACWLAMWTAALWDSSPVAPRERAGWATRASFTRFIYSSLHNGRASEHCSYSISYASFVHEASVRWPYGFWRRILLGNSMKPSEGKLSPNSRSNMAANRSQKALTVGEI